jgi:hypothetical protein
MDFFMRNPLVPRKKVKLVRNITAIQQFSPVRLMVVMIEVQSRMAREKFLRDLPRQWTVKGNVTYRNDRKEGAWKFFTPPGTT